jgi:predicted ATPase/class 3 adenylate cyclase
VQEYILEEALGMRCPKCSFLNPDGMRFCGRCGSSLLASDTRKTIPPQLVSKILSQVKTLEGERRRVTVLFADISGYTSISEEMDPEDLASFANEVFKGLGEVIYRFEGIIDKYMGDCVMAIFGAPVTHEDDPERALRAALSMMDEIKEMSRSVSLHVGVNSGEVVAGKIGSDLKMEYTVMGDTVNLAERLTRVAPAGEIYVSANTHRLTRHAFEFEDLGPLALKGKKEKTRAFKLKGIRQEPGRSRGVPGIIPQFLGRDDELNTLHQNLDRVREGASRAVFVLGEAGVGKSRLIDEFRKSSAGHARWLEGRCSSYTATAQFFPFAQLLEEALLNDCAEEEQDHTRSALERIKALIPERWEDVATSVARILPFDLEKDVQDTTKYLDPKTLRVRTFVAVRDLLEALSQTRPLVVAIDDIHWADESSQDLVQFLIETTGESPIMIIGATRPTPGSKWELIQRETTQKLPSRTDTIDLERLSKKEMEELIDLLLERPSMKPETRVRILEKSGGSPFYLEEIIKNLIEGNVLSKREDRWVCEADCSQVLIPETVEAVIASRIDKLKSQERSLVRCASVLGTDFTHDDLMCVTGSTDSIEDELAGLLRSGLVVERGSRKREYRFAHPLIHEVAHGGILRGSRKELHLRAAGCIERNYSQSLDQHFGALGMHYEIGGKPSIAFSYYFKAGRKARESYANQEAIANLTKALAIAPEGSDDRTRIVALIERARVHRLRGENEPALADFTSALSLSRAKNDDKYEADSLIGLSQTYGWTSRFPEMEDASREALELYRRLDDKDGESESLSQLGYARQMKGEYDEAIRLYTQALERSTAADNRLERSNCLNNLGAAYCSQGDLKRGLGHFESSLEIKREIGDLEGEAANLHNLGYIKLTLGNKEQALDLYTASLNLKERIGDRAGAAVTLNSLGAVFIGMGEYDRGLEYCKRALKAREEVGDRRGQAYTLQNMSGVLTMTGPLAEAADTLNRSFEIMQEVDDREGQALVLTSLGKLSTDNQEYDAAQRYLKNAATIAEEIGASRVLSRARSELALIALLCGQENEAKAFVALVRKQVGESGTPEMKAISLWLQAALGAMREDISEAKERMAQARRTAERGVDRAVAARWGFHIAHILKAAGAAALAREELQSSRDLFRKLGAGLWLERARTRAF